MFTVNTVYRNYSSSNVKRIGLSAEIVNEGIGEFILSEPGHLIFVFIV